MNRHSVPQHFACVLLGAVILTFGAAAQAQEKVNYTRDVKPVLADNCFQCHGFDDKARKANLRLDARDAAIHGGKSGAAAIVPGKADQSEIIRRITSSDPEKVMPPPDTKKKVSPKQVHVLKRWIEAGGEYQNHWAFVAPQRPVPPKTSQPEWAKNDIDRFVLARLEKEGLKPSSEADRATLLRRLSLDLIGLPPSPAELDAFINDPAPDAYARQVERLLTSPHFGEKWARHWLDVARYADSDGYEKDLARKQHPWRDWVINAINRDMPYDQFITEQLAGDLLPGATQDQRIATGFLRNGMVNDEGAIVAEQFRMEGMFDRMDVIGKGILGLTIQCAQCHSHKFDPLTHEEYYRLFAFLNNDYEAITWIYSPEQLKQIGAINEGIAAQEAKLKSDHPDWQAKQLAWEDAARKTELPWEELVPREPEWDGGLTHPNVMPDHSILTLGYRPNDGDLRLYSETKTANLTGLRLEALTHGDLQFGGPGRSNKGTFALSEIIVESMKIGAPADAKWEPVKLVNASADFEQPQQPISDAFKRAANDNRIVGPAGFMIDGKDETAWGTDPGPGRRHRDFKAVMQFEKPIANPEGTRFKFTLKFRHSGADGHGRQNQMLGRFRLSVTQSPSPIADPLPRGVLEALKLPPEKRSPAQRIAVFSHWRTTVPDYKPVNDEIEKLWKTFPEGEMILNLAQRQPDDARPTAILDRGSWQKPTRVVTPGVPAFLHPLSDPAGAQDRLTFARWLVDRRSPTTARVAVNRIWQALFGTGIVETAEDFGVRGSEPSHLELLDWLAVEFMDPSVPSTPSQHWSTRQLLRTIVMSATYRQSSRVTPDMVERDPHNRLLARGPRFRAEAEVVRDSSLAAAGLLNDRVGGPSFYPPVPEGLLASNFIEIEWPVPTGAERYRRSLYVFRRRSMPDPLLQSFDAPNGDFSCARRPRSNTPLAALAGMNETIFVEAARALSLRVLKEGGKTDAERASYGFRLVTGRVPRAAEVEQILELLKGQRQRIADGWISSREISTGDPAKAPTVPPGASPTDVASWTIVSRVLLNLDEAMTKN